MSMFYANILYVTYVCFAECNLAILYVCRSDFRTSKVVNVGDESGSCWKCCRSLRRAPRDIESKIVVNFRKYMFKETIIKKPIFITNVYINSTVIKKKR